MNDNSLPSWHNDVKTLLYEYKTTTEKEWLDRGSKMSLGLQQAMLQRVPAFNDFVHKNGTKLISKENYLKVYERKELCWDGIFAGKSWRVSATSGSSGVPYYFPRQTLQDEYYAITAEAYMVQNFAIDKKSTLYINAFPMGVWIGGVFTYDAVTRVAAKGYSLSVITPGINKPEVIKAVQNLGADFDQIIIGAYAPFLKDILDDGEAAGVNWSGYNLKFVFSAEAFSEDFRDFVQKKVGLNDIYRDTLNHYGTVDLGTMAHETPLTVLVRRLAAKNQKIYNELFNEAEKTPTLAQFDPTLFYFESEHGNVICSSYSGLPLYKYDLKDHGGVLTRDKIDDVFSKNGIDLGKEIENAGISDTIWNLPFVYVYERSDFSVSFFAFQIYPETIRKALLKDDLPHFVTGKCTMQVDYDSEGAQQLTIHVELGGTQQPSEQLKQRVQAEIVQQLLSENSEYRKTTEENGVERMTPKVVLWPYEDPTYFRSGGKQKWVTK